MLPVIVTPQADEELQEHIHYIAQRNPDAAERVRARIMRRIGNLATHEMIGRPGRVPGTRELVITGTPYLAVYAIVAGTVYILHINHARQQWPSPDEDDE